MSKKYQEPIYKCDIKINVIGLSGTGKTSFVQKYLKNTFVNIYKPTVVSEFGVKVVQRNGENYRIQIWDMAGKAIELLLIYKGQDKNVNITKFFIKDALGYIVCADSTNKTSFEDSLKWKKVIDDIALFPDQEKLPNMLLENKVDLIPEDQRNDNTALKSFAEQNHFDGCFKTSAKEGLNIDAAMDFIIDNILGRMKKLAEKGEVKEVFKSGRIIVEASKQQVHPNQIRNKNDNCC